MAGDWRIVPLRNVLGEKGYIRGPFGSALRRPELRAEGIPVYEQQHAITGTREFRFFIDEDKYEKLRRFTVQEDDLIISCSGTLGRVSMIRRDDPKGIISQALLILRPDKSVVVPKYLYYFISSARGFNSLVEVSTGSVQVNIARRSIIENTELPLPPIYEQQAIACILGALDDKIELNRRMNQTLEEMARAIFKSWFVDFDPVRAKAASRQLPGFAHHIADLFPDTLVGSALGEIPEDWRVGTLADFTDLLGGYAFKSKDWIGQGTPVVKIGSVKPGIVDLSQVSYVSHEVASAASRFRLDVADLLIGMTGYVGEVGLVPPTQNLPLLNQRVGKFVLEEKGTRRLGFVYGLTRRPEFKTAVIARSHGTAQANVSAQAILSIEVVIPPKPLRDCFDDLCRPLLDRILANHGESHILSDVRDTLLPKLISGELRIPDAKRIVERAV